MDRHDEQFESYLQQFRLRKPGPLPEIASLKRRSAVAWVLAAAAVVLAVGLSVVLVRNAGTVGGPRAIVESAGNPSLYQVGETIESGNVIRSNSAVGLLLALEDGSRVEMHAQSVLKLESAGDGIRVRLSEGSILVTAAKQRTGHLYVQTRDAVVSVVGTVFLVSAEQSGTIVSVVEGEVHVQQGAELKKLLPGEQVATNLSIKLKTVAEEISWSRSSSEYTALLRQPAEIAPPSLAPVAAPQTGPSVTVPANQDQNNTFDMLAKYNEAYKPNALPFKVQANYVRLTSEKIRTMITIQIMNRDLAFRDVGGRKRAGAHVEGTIYRIDNRRVDDFYRDLSAESNSSSYSSILDQSTLFQEVSYLDPGKYKLHIKAVDKNSQSIGMLDYALNVPRISDQSLQASSLILAYNITDPPPGMLSLNEKKVTPNASGIFRTSENLNVWQEIYGLSVDSASGKPSATFELVISQDKREVRKLASTATELWGPGQTMTFTNSVPLGNVAPGPYDIQLKVTDNFAKVSLITVGKFSVAGSSAQSPPSRQNAGSAIFYRACNTCHSPQVMNSQNFATKEEYSALVGREAGKGASVTRDEIPILVDYLFDTYGKKPDTYIPSDIPLQRQVK